MNRGYFRATTELMASPQWTTIEAEIKKHINLIEIIPRANGINEIHGESDLFKITPIEGATQQYELWFKNDDQGIPRITHANPEK